MLALLVAVMLATGSEPVVGQTIDTLVDVGGSRLHFHVVRGTGLPIVFESGGGDGATVWDSLLPRVGAVTGATLVTYDRAGWGRSELDTARHGIVHGVEGLETGLRKLGMRGDVMLVAHSFGGFYATVFANRHPRRVKAAVLLDANTACFYTDDEVRRVRGMNADLAAIRARSVASYYQAVDFDSIVATVRRSPFPSEIPVIDLVAERTPFEGTPNADRWRDCHRQFAAAAPNRIGLTAYGSGHYIFVSSPELVTAAIANAYARAVGGARSVEVLSRASRASLDAINDMKRKAAPVPTVPPG
jgi:pimeloyl-ACP methyl ester carboxylesterase